MNVRTVYMLYNKRKDVYVSQFGETFREEDIDQNMDDNSCLDSPGQWIDCLAGLMSKNESFDDYEIHEYEVSMNRSKKLSINVSVKEKK